VCSRVIFSIKKIKRSRDLYFCTFRDGDRIRVNAELLYRHALHTGMPLTEKEYEALKSEAAATLAKEQALRLLSFRIRSEEELSRRLRLKGVRTSVARAVVDDLKNAKLVDDEEFSRRYISDLLRRKPAGEYLIKAELKKKGIPEQTIDRVLHHVFSEHDQVELARKCVQQWHKRHAETAKADQRKKVSQFLYRRGFSWQIIEEVLGD